MSGMSFRLDNDDDDNDPKYLNSVNVVIYDAVTGRALSRVRTMTITIDGDTTLIKAVIIFNTSDGGVYSKDYIIKEWNNHNILVFEDSNDL